MFPRRMGGGLVPESRPWASYREKELIISLWKAAFPLKVHGISVGGGKRNRQSSLGRRRKKKRNQPHL